MDGPTHATQGVACARSNILAEATEKIPVGSTHAPISGARVPEDRWFVFSSDALSRRPSSSAREAHAPRVKSLQCGWQPFLVRLRVDSAIALTSLCAQQRPLRPSFCACHQWSNRARARGTYAIQLLNSNTGSANALDAPRRCPNPAVRYGYLQTVYHDSLPRLPIELRSWLELLYPALLPTQVCLQTPRRPEALRLPLCAADACAAWLPGPPPGEQRVADFLAGRTFIWTAAVGGESRRPFGHVVALQPPLALRRSASAQLGWVEVLRRKASVPEGWNNSGCWFHQVRPFIHTCVTGQPARLSRGSKDTSVSVSLPGGRVRRVGVRGLAHRGLP